MKRAAVIGASVVTVIGVGAFLAGRSTPQPQPTPETAERVPASVKAVEKQTSTLQETLAAVPTAVPAAPVEAPTKLTAVTIKEQKARLAEYAVLQRKVFLTDKEKAERARMMNDARFVRGLELLLRSVPTAEVTPELQNQAVDLLLEARESTRSEAAAQAMAAIIKDNQIENESMPQATRESLAGVKAEILYRWSAQEPGLSTQMPGWLPGPVSRTIWDNVLTEQAKNVAESRRELKR